MQPNFRHLSTGCFCSQKFRFIAPCSETPPAGEKHLGSRRVKAGRPGTADQPEAQSPGVSFENLLVTIICKAAWKVTREELCVRNQ